MSIHNYFKDCHASREVGVSGRGGGGAADGGGAGGEREKGKRATDV
jgi:hypothetical protein